MDIHSRNFAANWCDAFSMKKVAELLMCAPTYYDVDYVINPWMEGNVHAPSKARAGMQWRALHAELSKRAQVRLVEGVLGSPDMVFTANAGLRFGSEIALSRFQFAERQGEAAWFEAWFRAAGLTVRTMPVGVPFEGEGDALWAVDGARLWAGWGFRTALESHRLLENWWGIEVASLRLVDPRFYHLDTCFAPLPNGDVLYFPDAFDEPSRRAIEAYYPASRRVIVSEADATTFCCNAVCLGSELVMNHVSRQLRGELEGRGFEVCETPLDEFLKAGGAAKCLVMTLASASRDASEYMDKTDKDGQRPGAPLASGTSWMANHPVAD
jgi:N-dimethylarginine dimethylaminohydrolase